MTKLTLEIQSDRDLAILTAFLKLLNVKILGKENKAAVKKNTASDFYKNINLNLSNFKFDRDEANER